MNAGRVLLALCAWLHFALVIWVCFLLPTQGDWDRKLELASTTPLLIPLMLTTSIATWLCRNQPLLLVTAAILVGLDMLTWSSRYWL